MQNDQKNSISMNPSYTLFKLNIRCLKNASWAGNSEWLPYKQEQSWMHSTVFLGSLFHNRHLFMYSAGSFTGKYHCFSNKLKYDWNVADLCQAATLSNCKAYAGFLYSYCMNWKINCLLTSFSFHSSNKYSHIRPCLSHSVLQHIQSFLFGFTTFFTLVENNVYTFSFITDGDSFPGTTVVFHVKVTPWKHLSISAFSRALKSTVVKNVGCSQSAFLSLSPTCSSPVTFPAQ